MNVLTYARVSTEDQRLDPQQIELRDYCARSGFVIEQEFSDTISGGTSSRPGLDALVDRCSLGGIDAVVTVKLDRLGRSVLNVVSLVQRLKDMGVALICTSQGIDTRDENPCGKLIMGVLASCAEFEKSIIQERTRAGLRAAKARGKTLGRPSAKLIPEWQATVAQWRDEGGKGVRELAKRLGGVSTSTASRLAKSK